VRRRTGVEQLLTACMKMQGLKTETDKGGGIGMGVDGLMSAWEKKRSSTDRLKQKNAA
jgi:hypothetical protein